MTENNEELKAIIDCLMKAICTLPAKTIIGTDKLLKKLGIICKDGEDEIKIHYSLIDAARKKDIYLETECYDSIDEKGPTSLAFTIYHNTPCYWYCGVGFEDIMTIHHYISEMGHIASGTYVEVPFGDNNRPVIGQVQLCGICMKNNYSCLKYITRIATKEEYDAQPENLCEDILNEHGRNAIKDFEV